MGRPLIRPNFDRVNTLLNGTNFSGRMMLKRLRERKEAERLMAKSRWQTTGWTAKYDGLAIVQI